MGKVGGILMILGFCAIFIGAGVIAMGDYITKKNKLEQDTVVSKVMYVPPNIRPRTVLATYDNIRHSHDSEKRLYDSIADDVLKELKNYQATHQYHSKLKNIWKPSIDKYSLKVDWHKHIGNINTPSYWHKGILIPNDSTVINLSNSWYNNEYIDSIEWLIKIDVTDHMQFTKTIRTLVRGINRNTWVDGRWYQTWDSAGKYNVMSIPGFGYRSLNKVDWIFLKRIGNQIIFINR